MGQINIDISMAIKKALTVLLAVVMLLAPIGGAVGSVGATSPALDATEVQPSASGNLPGDFVNASESVDVWERAVRPLRLDRSDDAGGIATSVDSMNVIVEGSGGSSFLRDSDNRNMVVYRDDATADISFDLGEAGATTEINGDSVHLIAAKAESPDDPELPSSTDIQTLRDFIRDEADNENIIFENASTKSVSSGTADFSYDFSGSNRGAGGYVFMAVYTESGQGVNINNGNLSVDGSVSVLGTDTAMVQDTSSTIDSKGSDYKPGDNITFDVDANLATDDNRVEHVVALWNESNVASESLRIIAPDDISNETTTSDFTVNHSIKSVSGVQNMEDDVSAFGRTLSKNRRAGVYELADIVSFLANEGNISGPKTNPVESNVVNASATAINATGSDVGITVETNKSFNNGDYVVVHMAVADGNLTKSSSNRADITLGGDGGDGGDIGGGGYDGGDDDDDSEDDEDDDDTQVEPPEPIEPPEPPADVEVLVNENADLAFDQETNRTTATFGENNSVESVSFASEVTGTVNARTLSAAPNETGPAPGSSTIVAQINVGDDLTNNSATVRKRVTRDRLSEIGADAEDLTAFRFADGEWQPLETEVANETNQRVALEFEAPGFSYFAVSATSAPTAAIDAPSEVDAGTEVTLDASGSSTEYGEITSYDWSVDGESLSGETATATLDEAGDVTVELTVTNDAGETDTASTTITVEQTDDGTDGTDGGDGTDGTDGGDDSTDDGIPGFGPLVALVALVAAALLATRRND